MLSELPDNRVTEFYDEYLDSYNDNAPQSANGAQPDRIAQWASANANPNFSSGQSMRFGPRSAPASNYAPSSFGTGPLRRKTTRRGISRAMSRSQSTYEEEEEGYVSGDYEDGPFELIKIRVKVYPSAPRAYISQRFSSYITRMMYVEWL